MSTTDETTCEQDEAEEQDYAQEIAEREADLRRLKEERSAAEREEAMAQARLRGPVQIPRAALIGAALSTIVTFVTFFATIATEGLFRSREDMFEELPGLLLMMTLALGAMALLEYSRRSPGAHESRGVITWGLLMSWMSVVFVLVPLIGSLLLDPPSASQTIIEDLGNTR